MNARGSTTADLACGLRDALDLRAVARPVPTARYRFSMANDFVRPDGRILRRQLLQAGYTRRLIGALSAQTALFGLTWTWVQFSSTSTDQSRTASQSPIRWSFAEGRGFQYHRRFPADSFPQPATGQAPPTQFRVGDWYDDLASLPSVNLLAMATWDVVTFEDLTGHLACDGLGRYGTERPVPTMDNAHVHLDFKGYAVEDCAFENAAVVSQPAGLTLVADAPCTGIDFQGSGRLEIGGDRPGRSQQGESYYVGNCYLSMDDADLASARMTELLTVWMKNSGGKHVPMHKRRVVRIVREDQHEHQRNA